MIRISSTFFWHLSADYDLVPIPELAAKAHARRADAITLGRTDVEEEENIYDALKVGQQVQKYVYPRYFVFAARMLTAVPSELKHIALMA